MRRVVGRGDAYWRRRRDPRADAARGTRPRPNLGRTSTVWLIFAALARGRRPLEGQRDASYKISTRPAHTTATSVLRFSAGVAHVTRRAAPSVVARGSAIAASTSSQRSGRSRSACAVTGRSVRRPRRTLPFSDDPSPRNIHVVAAAAQRPATAKIPSPSGTPRHCRIPSPSGTHPPNFAKIPNEPAPRCAQRKGILKAAWLPPRAAPAPRAPTARRGRPIPRRSGRRGASGAT